MNPFCLLEIFLPIPFVFFSSLSTFHFLLSFAEFVIFIYGAASTHQAPKMEQQQHAQFLNSSILDAKFLNELLAVTISILHVSYCGCCSHGGRLRLRPPSSMLLMRKGSMPLSGLKNGFGNSVTVFEVPVFGGVDREGCSFSLFCDFVSCLHSSIPNKTHNLDGVVTGQFSTWGAVLISKSNNSQFSTSLLLHVSRCKPCSPFLFGVDEMALNFPILIPFLWGADFIHADSILLFFFL
ncbi:hypothetical protein C1H46_032786 [Malus baccata]|uniref:Uncharacterized protein n=1 Tax=Malus baccata TaxID=106549 RepID=A0A540L5L0_MALBA|nr:hypothetical protein C1H46_032786 [Malus baccata]